MTAFRFPRVAALSVLVWIPAVLALAPRALADVGPVDETCTADKRCPGKGRECAYVNSDPDARAATAECENGAIDAGLERACVRGGGTVGSTVYCPKGTTAASDGGDGGSTAGTVTKGGCSETPTAHDPASAAAAWAGLLVASAALVRWRRRAGGAR